MRIFTFVCCFKLLWNINPVLANVEKTIFITPFFIHSPTDVSRLDELNLEELSPVKRSIRRQIPAIFPNTTSPRGAEIWFLLKGLEEQQRYEARICWPATQPTSFTLDTYDLDEVFKAPVLFQSLAAYSKSRPPDTHPKSSLDPVAASQPVRSTILLLRILAAADYFTTNTSLMHNVPLVNVDISIDAFSTVLDPFLFNILPSSLLPTAIYLAIIAIGAWFLSDFIWASLYRLSLSSKTLISSPDPKTASAKKTI